MTRPSIASWPSRPRLSNSTNGSNVSSLIDFAAAFSFRRAVFYPVMATSLVSTEMLLPSSRFTYRPLCAAIPEASSKG
jgi:hypothetical protein